MRNGAANLHAYPLELQVSLCCLHPKEEIKAPVSFDIKEFVGNILLALVLLGEANGRTILDLN